MITYLKRIGKQGWLLFSRNRAASSAAVLMSTVMAFSILGGFVVSNAATAFLEAAKLRLDFSIYFTDSAPTDTISALQKRIEALPYVTEVRLVTKEEALEWFRDTNKLDPAVTQGLKELGFNPFSDYLVIKTSDARDYEKLYEYVKNSREYAHIDSITFSQNKAITDRLIKISDILGIALLGGGAFLFFAVLLIISNTMRLIAHSQHQEIEIMKLVGASDMYLRVPYLILAALFALLGTFLAGTVLFGGIFLVGSEATKLIPGYHLNQYLGAEGLRIAAFALGVTLFANVLSILFSIHKYLDI